MEKKIEPQKDWISELQDDILVDILSRLEFKEAAQSTFLSHRWMNLWTCVPRLHFDATKGYSSFLPPKEMRKQMAVFANRVNRVLALRELNSSFSLREFRIWFVLDKGHQKDIDKWLDYAFRRGVERLELNLCKDTRHGVLDKHRYIFPNHFLELGTELAPKASFSHVRALYFTAVNISGEAIQGLLLKCPLLEDLRVIASNVLVNLLVSGPSISLKHLQISECNEIKSITISNTNIGSLRLSDFRENGHILLNHLPMLREVWINGLFKKKSMLFSQLACCLSQLTTLTLETDSYKFIMQLYEIPELKNLRRLVLVASICRDNCLLGLTSLIESCPRLVEFALMLVPLNLSPRRDVGTEPKYATEETLKGLKVFELYGYCDIHTNEMELIKFMIEKAVDLEKIIIDPRYITTYYFEKPVERYGTKERRMHAIENVKGLVPKQVELILL